MAKIAELKKYLGHEFSSRSYTGEDYKSFQTKYINYLKAICRKLNGIPSTSSSAPARADSPTSRTTA